MADMEVLMRQRMGKSYYMQQMLATQMANLKPGQKILVIKGINDHITITRNQDQIEHKGDNVADVMKRMRKDGEQKTILFHFAKAGVVVYQIVNNNVTQHWSVTEGMTFDSVDAATEFLNGQGWV